MVDPTLASLPPLCIPPKVCIAASEQLLSTPQIVKLVLHLGKFVVLGHQCLRIPAGNAAAGEQWE
jgi:hypothetical protein